MIQRRLKLQIQNGNFREKEALPTKLGVKIVRGQVELQTREVPDLDEVKRLWKEGKPAQYILEEMKRKRKKAA